MNTRNAYAYDLVVADGISQLQLLLLVYDAVARDLVRAAQAVDEGNIEQRCYHSRHALLLLGHLESWVPDLEDPKLGAVLQKFYSMLRDRILQMQVDPDSAGFFELAQFVYDTRASWKAREDRALSRANVLTSPEKVNSGQLSFRA